MSRKRPWLVAVLEGYRGWLAIAATVGLCAAKSGSGGRELLDEKRGGGLAEDRLAGQFMPGYNPAAIQKEQTCETFWRPGGPR